MILNPIVALLPVVLFLAVLMLMDNFKLARPAAIARTIGWGIAAAIICNATYATLADLLLLSDASFSRYVAPVTEETAKAAFVVYLITRRRIGFPVDAAQLGFAVGTGFALVENFQFLRVLSHAGAALWIVRGLGTAILHGATTAIFAMVSKTRSDRASIRRWLVFVPGWILAVAIHSAFNHVLLPPVQMTALLLIVLPLLMLLVFERSENATREWVGAGLDLDLVLIEMFSSDGFGQTRFGRYLQELQQRFPAPIVVDMLCLLRVELELSVQAKAMLMARQAGLVVPVHPDARSAIQELRDLRRSIGRSGLLALQPLQVTTHRDEWHRHLLGGLDRGRSSAGWRRWTRRQKSAG